MNPKPFIHPDLLITIKQTLNESSGGVAEAPSFTNAKHVGEEFANSLLKNLFSIHEEYGEVKSHFNTERLTSEKLADIRESIVSMHYQRKLIGEELVKRKREQGDQTKKLVSLQDSFFSFLYKKRIARYENELSEINAKVELVSATNSECFINLKFEYDSSHIRDAYSDFVSAFTTMKSANKIWDVITTQRNLDTKAAAGKSITRNEVTIDFTSIDSLQTNTKVLHFENYNGGDFYFYPNFIVYFKSNDQIALIDYSELYIVFTRQEFLEERRDLPVDSTVVGETWYRVNKDGTPDKRFASNYIIPIAQYGSLHFKTASGVNELYYISDVHKAEHFVNQFNRYQMLVRRFK